MCKLFPVYINSSLLAKSIPLLIRYGEIIFSENENPVAVFIEGLEKGLTRAIAAVNNNDDVIGIVVFYDFTYLSDEKFVCYMYGAGKRGVATVLEQAFKVIFDSLKLQGCLAVRFETKKYNMPMRFMARRMGFRKVGKLCGYMKNGSIGENILYEKIL